MKKRYSSFLLLFILLLAKSYAQNSCSTPYPFVSGSTYTYASTLSTPNPDTTNDYGCLSTQSNVHWLYLGICTSGPITLTISSASSSGMDVDFIAYGPLGSAIDCGLDSTQIIDCSFSTGVTETVTIPSAMVGEFYKIMISNYSNIPGSVTITQTAGLGAACDSTTYICSGIPVFNQPICKVTTDPVINHNFIFWDKDTAFTGFYNIQKETTTAGVYSTIASVPATDTSVYEDMVSNPMIQSFKYRIVTADTCGNSIMGAPHTTIHLLTSVSSSTGYPQLSWNPYVGFGYGTYFIYRGSSPATLSLYDSISSSFITYTDVAPAAGLSYYAVAVFPPTPCNPSHSFQQAFSNIAPVVVTGIDEVILSDLIVSPNPASNELNFNTYTNYEFTNIDIFDVAGRKLVSSYNRNSNHITINISDLANGYYITKITTDKGIAQRTIIVSK